MGLVHQSRGFGSVSASRARRPGALGRVAARESTRHESKDTHLTQRVHELPWGDISPVHLGRLPSANSQILTRVPFQHVSTSGPRSGEDGVASAPSARTVDVNDSRRCR